MTDQELQEKRERVITEIAEMVLFSECSPSPEELISDLGISGPDGFGVQEAEAALRSLFSPPQQLATSEREKKLVEAAGHAKFVVADVAAGGRIITQQSVAKSVFDHLVYALSTYTEQPAAEESPKESLAQWNVGTLPMSALAKSVTANFDEIPCVTSAWYDSISKTWKLPTTNTAIPARVIAWAEPRQPYTGPAEDAGEKTRKP